MNSREELIEARLLALERSRRRERVISGSAIAMLLIALHAWSPSAQPLKPLDQRVEDLEKRIGITAGAGPNQPIKFQTPFVIRSAGGEIVMKVDDEGGYPTLELGAPTAGGVSMGRDSDSASGFITVRTGLGRPGAEMAGDPMGVRVFAPDGKAVQGALELNDNGNGQLRVGLQTGGGVVLGVGDSGSGFAMTRRRSGTVGVDIGRFDGGPEGVYVVSESGKRAASLVADAAGGRLTVMNAGGTSVGGLQATGAGGRVALAGAGGGMSQVSLGATPGGGMVSVFGSKGGSARVSLAGEDDSGSVTGFDSEGSGVGWIEAEENGAGRFVLQNKEGMMVEAGSGAESGVGFVRTGPGQKAGAMGLPGSFIMGKK